jgi:hypothetical protein
MGFEQKMQGDFFSKFGRVEASKDPNEDLKEKTSVELTELITSLEFQVNNLRQMGERTDADELSVRLEAAKRLLK